MLTDSKIFEMAFAHGACWPDEHECELSRAQLVAFARSIEAAERERWRTALSACEAALAQCQPCADPECVAMQRDYIDTARAAAEMLLRPNVGVEPVTPATEER